MEPSTRTFLLLALTLVAINGSKPDKAKNILRETIESVDKIQQDHSDGSKKIITYVDDIFSGKSCTKETLCQAALVLKNTHLKTTMLVRNLFAYANHTRHRHCSVPASVKSSHPMAQFLTKIKKCCQNLLNNVK